MSKTFKVNNNPHATGAIQAQSLRKETQTSKKYTANSPHEKQLDFVSIVNSKDKNSLSSDKGLTLKDVIASLEDDNTKTNLLLDQNKFINRIVPDIISMNNFYEMERAEDSTANSNIKNLEEESYEKLTGSPQTFPEILAMIDFLPFNRK